jgi:hypothetical protein
MVPKSEQPQFNNFAPSTFNTQQQQYLAPSRPQPSFQQLKQ